MQAPRGVNSATILGHSYGNIGKDGIIKVVNTDHIPILTQHGFEPAADQEEDREELEAKIDRMDDKDKLVTFIEERGGEADNEMSFKKLRRLAKESLTTNED